jgi:tRNA threonylcarbamoyl adenosine modification protein YeaZ
MERGQAERLLPLLEETLTAGGAGWRDLAALAVCTGPGNFTGLRIAVAAARGLAFGLGLPAVGVGRLEALAAGTPGHALVALDLRRGAVAVQEFRDGVALGPPRLAPPEALAALAPGARRLGAAAAPGTAEARETPDPATLARIAAGRRAGAPPPAPLYLRPADAALPAEPAPALIDDA